MNPSKRGNPTSAIRQFFLNNPDEMLGIKDFQVKFDLTENHARTIVRNLRLKGELIVREMDGRACLYGVAA